MEKFPLPENDVRSSYGLRELDRDSATIFACSSRIQARVDLSAITVLPHSQLTAAVLTSKSQKTTEDKEHASIGGVPA